MSDTGQPLVFIIDELDRCRPTFAIELLERVKHIFDVPNIVFVFGINRSELVKALDSRSTARLMQASTCGASSTWNSCYPRAGSLNRILPWHLFAKVPVIGGPILQRA